MVLIASSEKGSKDQGPLFRPVKPEDSKGRRHTAFWHSAPSTVCVWGRLRQGLAGFVMSLEVGNRGKGRFWPFLARRGFTKNGCYYLGHPSIRNSACRRGAGGDSLPSLRSLRCPLEVETSGQGIAVNRCMGPTIPIPHLAPVSESLPESPESRRVNPPTQ